MTTIAWDGMTLAADKRATAGSLTRTVTKLYRVRGALCALFISTIDGHTWRALGDSVFH